jgi:phage tail-like protein
VIEELLIATGPESRDAGGSQTPGQPPAGFTFELSLANGQRFNFVAASGIGSVSEVIEHRIIGPTGEIIEKIPGRLSWGDVKLRCITECGELLHAWRTQVVAGQIAQARQDVSLRLTDAAGTVAAHWDFESAWPSQIRIVPAPTGGTFEELTLVHEGGQRVQ